MPGAVRRVGRDPGARGSRWRSGRSQVVRVAAQVRGRDRRAGRRQPVRLALAEVAVVERRRTLVGQPLEGRGEGRQADAARRVATAGRAGR